MERAVSNYRETTNMAATFKDTTLPVVVVPSGTTATPFGNIIVNETTLGVGATENLTVRLLGINPGTLSDPQGGAFDPATQNFTESSLATVTPTPATSILGRLVYTAPTIQAGTFAKVVASISVDNGKAGGVVTDAPITLEIVTPPGFSSINATNSVTSGATFRPFAGVTVADDNLAHDSKDTGTLTLSNAAGAPTDADGTLTGPGLTKTGVGLYTLNSTATVSFQSNLGQLLFTPAPVSAGATRTTGFTLSVSDDATSLKTDNKVTSVQVVGATPTPTAPLIAGTLAGQKVEPGNAIHPFNRVQISDSNAMPNLRVSLRLTGSGTLGGSDKLAAGPSAGGQATYALAASTPDAITAELQKLVFYASPLGSNASLTSTISLSVADNALVTLDEKTSVIESAPPPVVPDPTQSDPTKPPLPSGNFIIADQTTGQRNVASGEHYNGPVSGLDQQFVLVNPDNLNITATIPNAFIHSGSGTDAVDVSHSNGNNVLDGSTGSNFLVGGTGRDTFFLDDRNPTADVFSTVVNFHAGDNVTIFGVNATNFQTLIRDDQGAVGAKGLTYTFSAPNQPNASIVIAGYNTGDLTNGRLSAVYGSNADLPGQPGSGGPYLNIRGN